MSFEDDSSQADALGDEEFDDAWSATSRDDFRGSEISDEGFLMRGDDPADFGDGLTDEHIQSLALDYAERLMNRGGTLADVIDRTSQSMMAVMSAKGLPHSVQLIVRSFLPALPETVRVGQRLVGLHNGHSYCFRGWAKQLAGELMVGDGRREQVTLVEQLATKGHLVANSARVAQVSSGDEIDMFDHDMSALPAEFAVLVPGDASPIGYLQDMFESCEDWFDEANIVDSFDAGSDCQELFGEAPHGQGSTVGFLSSLTDSRVQHNPRQSQTCGLERYVDLRATSDAVHDKLKTPKDQRLLHAAGYSGPNSEWNPVCALVAIEGVGLETVRKLLNEGANPLVKSSDAKMDACGVATQARADLRHHIEGLLAGTLSRDHFHWLTACWFESITEARNFARNLLEEGAELVESVALLTAASAVWGATTPASQPVRLGDHYRGCGVPVPNLTALRAALADVPQHEANDGEVESLAQAVWKLGEPRRAEREAKAMAKEDIPSRKQLEREVNAMAKEDLRRCGTCENFLPLSSFSKTQMQKNSPSRRCQQCMKHTQQAAHGPNVQEQCSACMRGYPLSAFSKNQLSKGSRRRCRECITKTFTG